MIVKDISFYIVILLTTTASLFEKIKFHYPEFSDIEDLQQISDHNCP